MVGMGGAGAQHHCSFEDGAFDGFRDGFSVGEYVVLGRCVARSRRRNMGACGWIFIAAMLGSMLVLAAGKPLLGGSLTWTIDTNFASGDRLVSFSLMTAFEMDLSCTYTPGAAVACGAEDYGVLCVDQYAQASGGSDTTAPVVRRLDRDTTPKCKVDQGLHTGTKNSFKVVRTKNVNGVNIVFGKRMHSVVVNSTTTLLMAYWQPEAESASRGVMEVCSRNATELTTPCALNDLSDFPRGQSSFWSSSLRSDLPQTPSLETIVPVCATSGQYSPCAASNGTDPIGNYYSPVPIFPALVEVAVTARTNKAVPDDVETAWFFNVSGNAYAAPTAPFLFKSFDQDGQQMTQYSPGWQSDQSDRSNSMLEVKCFEGFLNGTASAYDSSGQGDWPWSEGSEGRCSHYFDGDGGGGSLLKFDFDFGTNVWTDPYEGPNYVAPVNDTMSWLFGSDPFRCIGRGLQQCSSSDDPQVCTQGARSVACSGHAMFSQHSLYTLDLPFLDVDNMAGTAHISTLSRWFSLSGVPVSTQVQSIFSAYPCFAGRANEPPVFVKDLDSQPGVCRKVDLATDYRDAMSEVRCRPGEMCVIPLLAQDFTINEEGKDSATGDGVCPGLSTTPGKPLVRFQSSDVVQIELAAGWDEGNYSMVQALCEGTTTACSRDSDCSGGATCTSAGDFALHTPSADPKCQAQGGAAKCFFREMFQAEDVGVPRIRCFVAKDAHGDRTVPSFLLPSNHPPVEDGACRPPASCAPSVEQMTCRSPPMCVKIVVEGRAPYFTAPTPLEANSFDDQGLLVENRTDVAACEGFPMELTLAAKDDDRTELVRIFVEDVDISAGAIPAGDARQLLQHLSDGDNLDFFAATSAIPEAFWSEFPARCVGNTTFAGYGAVKVGDNQAQADIRPLDGRKSVVSPYLPQLQYVQEPQLSVAYTLDVAAKNGIVVRQDCAASAGPSCREKLLNMDQVICAVAYDDSRLRAKRWVGVRDPNGNAIPRAFRDHSNGDMASPRHCWRIRLQAPPRFVTSPVRDASPFADAWNVESGDGSPTTGRPAAYKKVNAAIGQNVTYTFVAQDPNPEDSVRIFIVDDPGMPPGMTAESVECIPRAGDEAMCRAEAVESVNQSRTIFMLDDEYASSCSKAKLELHWTPAPEQAGVEFTVCVVARDSSTMCVGKGPLDATSAGWYGEQHCVEILVVKPDLFWVEDMTPSEITAYVGCQTRFHVKAMDAGGLYGVNVEADGTLPRGATVEAVEASPGATEVALMWVPPRGTEGSTTEICFRAVDALRTQTPLEPRCYEVMVSKCRYCVGRGDTLSLVMKEYGLDSNWLRLWLHNGNTVPPTQAGPAVISNPDLIVTPHNVMSVEEENGNAGGLPVVYVGPVYKVHPGESLQTISTRFRTSIKSILSVNPDITGEDDVKAGETELCLIPCSQRIEKGPTAASAT